MTDDVVLVASRAAVGLAILALVALTVVHFLRRDLDPSRTMISRYASGPHGWLMMVCFAAWAAASEFLFLALVSIPSPSLARIGQLALLATGVGLALAAVFPMDPVGTPRRELSHSGKMHGIAFLIGVPALVLTVTMLSISLLQDGAYADMPMRSLAALILISFIVMMILGARVGPDHGPTPNVPRLFGWVNRLLMVAYSFWLIVVAWPMAV